MKIAIIGLGYVGLPLNDLEFAQWSPLLVDTRNAMQKIKTRPGQAAIRKAKKHRGSLRRMVRNQSQICCA